MVFERIKNCIYDSWRGAAAACLTRTFDAQRVFCRGGPFVIIKGHKRHVVSPRHGVIEERPRHELAIVTIINRLFQDGLAQSLANPAHYLAIG